jgi:Tfp pilus assembly protein PilN
MKKLIIFLGLAVIVNPIGAQAPTTQRNGQYLTEQEKKLREEIRERRLMEARQEKARQNQEDIYEAEEELRKKRKK